MGRSNQEQGNVCNGKCAVACTTWQTPHVPDRQQYLGVLRRGVCWVVGGVCWAGRALPWPRLIGMSECALEMRWSVTVTVTEAAQLAHLAAN